MSNVDASGKTAALEPETEPSAADADADKRTDDDAEEASKESVLIAEPDTDAAADDEAEAGERATDVDALTPELATVPPEDTEAAASPDDRTATIDAETEDDDEADPSVRERADETPTAFVADSVTAPSVVVDDATTETATAEDDDRVDSDLLAVAAIETDPPDDAEEAPSVAVRSAFTPVAAVSLNSTVSDMVYTTVNNPKIEKFCATPSVC